MQHPFKHRAHGFTLVELLTVMAIIGVLASLLLPAIGRVRDNADSIRCVSNLKQIGVGLQSYAADHDNKLPIVEVDPNNPVYASDADAQPLITVLKPYNIPPQVFQCPSDMKAKLDTSGAVASPYYTTRNNSYEWRPLFDDENITAPKLYYTGRGGTSAVQARALPQSRVRLLLDYVNTGEAPHGRTVDGSSYNNLYADGSVRTLTIPKTATNW